MGKWILIIVTHLAVFLISSGWILAQEYQVRYDARYQPRLNGDAAVDFRINVVNLSSDRYIKELTLSFPINFAISDLSARDDHGVIAVVQETQGQFLKLKLTFSNPTIGKNLENNFYLSFLQKNLFKSEGTIWEVILPTIANKDNTTFNIKVVLPENLDKKLSVAKPKPTKINDNTIYWSNVQTRTVYAVFGDYQLYLLNLVYHLKNDELRRVYYDVALPPDTLYQKIFINALNPAPAKVYLDQDDNLLARYILNVKEEKRIVFDATVQVFAKPRDNLRLYFAKNFAKQKPYLLAPQDVWTIDDFQKSAEVAKLTTAEDIYRYAVNKLTYNYDRVNDDSISRLGASGALENPDQAVCMEFTDLFIAWAREQGIFAREVNGYGFSQDQNLRPLSLAADILHAWPEYFDETNNLWLPIDPTWEKTSGIDYWSSLDVNHVVFAIHGADPRDPAPAGTYKLDQNSKDVKIQPTTIQPKEIVAVSLDEDLQKNLRPNRNYRAKLRLTNGGNVYLFNSKLEVKSRLLSISPEKIQLEVLAPNQTAEYTINYRLNGTNKQTTVVFSFNDKIIRKVSVRSNWFDQTLIYLMTIAAGFGGFIFFLLYTHARR